MKRLHKWIAALALILGLCALCGAAGAAVGVTLVNPPSHVVTQSAFSLELMLTIDTDPGHVEVQYRWDGGSYTTILPNYQIDSGSATPILSILAPATPTTGGPSAQLEIQVVNANDPSDTDTASASIGIHDPVSAGSVSVIHNNGRSTFTVGEVAVLGTSGASGGSGNTTSEWFVNGDPIISNIYTFNSPGNHTITYTLTDNLTGSTDTASTTVTVLPAFAVTHSISPSRSTYYMGETVTLRLEPTGGLAPYTYSWGQQEQQRTLGTPGGNLSYYTVTDADGRSISGTIVMETIFPTALVALTNPPAALLPAGGSYAFSALVSGGPEPFTFAWALDGLSQPGASDLLTLTGLTPGMHTVSLEATNALGTVSAPATATFTVADPLALALSPAPVLRLGDTPAFTATPAGGDAASYSYAWTLDGGSLAGAGASVTLPPLSLGSHTLSVTLSDGIGSTPASEALTFSVEGDPLTVRLSAAPASLREGDTPAFTATPSGGYAPGYAYAWTYDGGSLAGAGDRVTLPALTAGTHTLSVTLADGMGSAPATDTVTFTVDPPVILPLEVTLEGPTGHLTGRYSRSAWANTTGGVAPYSYAWFMNDQRIEGRDRDALSFTPDRSGTFTLRVVVTDSAGQSAGDATAFTVTISEEEINQRSDTVLLALLRRWGYAVDEGYTLADLLALGRGGVLPAGTEPIAALEALAASQPADARTVLSAPIDSVVGARLVMLWPAEDTALSVAGDQLVLSRALVGLPASGTLTEALTLAAGSHQAWSLSALLTSEQLAGDLSLRPLGDQGVVLLSFDGAGTLIGDALLLLFDEYALIPLPGTEGASALALAPDGSRLAYRNGEGVFEMDLATLEVTPVEGTSSGPLQYLPDGTLMLGLRGGAPVLAGGGGSGSFSGLWLDEAGLLSGGRVRVVQGGETAQEFSYSFAAQ